MSANEKMPDKMDYVSNKITDYMGAEHSFNHLAHKNDYDNWLNVLQPCEISESELEKLKNKLVSCGYVLSLDTIEVTDIVELEWNKKYAVYELFFKQPKQVEEIEDVELMKYLDECIESCNKRLNEFKTGKMDYSYYGSMAMMSAYNNVKQFIKERNNGK